MISWILALMIAITIHEFSHAYVSYKLGDPTPKEEGRLTLNPIKHLDPLGLLFLVIVGIGWAAPVKVNPEYYKNKKQGLMLVAVAGPLSNFVLALLSVVVLVLTGGENSIGYAFIITLISINLILGIFNLIPLPPLDGSKILAGLLPIDIKLNDGVGFFILILLLLTGTLREFLMLVYEPIMAGINGII